MNDSDLTIFNPPPTSDIDRLEKQLVINRTLRHVMCLFDCSVEEALAAICRDWAEHRRVDLLTPNPLGGFGSDELGGQRRPEHTEPQRSDGAIGKFLKHF